MAQTPPVLPLVRQTRSECADCGYSVSEYGHLTCYRCAAEGTQEHAYHTANGVYEVDSQKVPDVSETVPIRRAFSCPAIAGVTEETTEEASVVEAEQAFVVEEDAMTEDGFDAPLLEFTIDRIVYRV